MKKKTVNESDVMIAMGMLRSVLEDASLRKQVKKQWRFTDREMSLLKGVANKVATSGIEVISPS